MAAGLRPTVDALSLVTLTLPDGRVLEFQMTLTPSCQTFTPLQYPRVTCVPVGNTLGTLVPADVTEVQVFASWPGPADLVDDTGAPFDPSLYRYTSPDGRVLLVHDTEGLKSVSDRNGNVLTVGPNGITHSSGQGVAYEPGVPPDLQRQEVLAPDFGQFLLELIQGEL